MVRLSQAWHIGFGARYERLLGDAAESPFVKDRGSPDQFIVGAGIDYAW
jgi:outer membrane protein